MSPIGYRVLPAAAQPVSSQMLQAFATVGVAQISDCMGRLYGVRGLRPLHAAHAGRLAGLARTVKTRPGDNLMIHKAISLAQPGEVLVVDGAGELANALVGELMAMDAERRGMAGFVIDGAVRDADVFAQGAFPCFARGVAHLGPYKDGPGEINVPVCVGGQVVCAGDVIVGDADGVLAIPAAQAEQVLAAAMRKEADEAAIKDKIRAGTYAKPWMDQAIAAKTGGAQ
ncbi:RraA family protein [Orrella sp. JC864]|uniref:RraA family protein n=1 Tax=Orrella sp. JC864 TaxID=3120298 RepID=UPI0030080458